MAQFGFCGKCGLERTGLDLPCANCGSSPGGLERPVFGKMVPSSAVAASRPTAPTSVVKPALSPSVVYSASPPSTTPVQPLVPTPSPAMPVAQQLPVSSGYAPSPPPVAPQMIQGVPVVVAGPKPDTTLVVVAWVIVVLSGFYMLPWAIAVTRGKSNQATIGLLNFLVGWSVIGWVIALAMACGSHQPPAGQTTIVVNNASNGAGQWNGPLPGGYQPPPPPPSTGGYQPPPPINF